MTNHHNLIKYTLTFFWWAAAIGLFAIAHIPVGRIMYVFTDSWGQSIANHYGFNTPELILQSIVSPIRGIVFLFSFTLMSGWIINKARRDYLASHPETFDLLKEIAVTALIFIVLCILVTPTGLHGLSLQYSNASLNLFDRLHTTQYHSRILLPALAHFTFFRGDLFYFLFSLLFAFFLVASLRFWFIQNKIKVSLLGLISVCTLGFINFQLHHPGYPDSIVFIFILTAFSFELDLYSKLSLFVLSLVAHEASLVIWSALAFCLFSSKREFIYFALVSFLFAGFMIVGAGGLENLIASRSVGGISNIDWILKQPGREFLGIFLAFRAFWLSILAGLWITYKNKDYKKLFQLLILLVTCIFMTTLGVDTSRLVGWGFMLVLMSWKIIDAQTNPRWEKLMQTIIILNLIIPPYFSQLIQPPYIPIGLYNVLVATLIK